MIREITVTYLVERPLCNCSPATWEMHLFSASNYQGVASWSLGLCDFLLLTNQVNLTTSFKEVNILRLIKHRQFQFCMMVSPPSFMADDNDFNTSFIRRRGHICMCAIANQLLSLHLTVFPLFPGSYGTEAGYVRHCVRGRERFSYASRSFSPEAL